MPRTFIPTRAGAGWKVPVPARPARMLEVSGGTGLSIHYRWELPVWKAPHQSMEGFGRALRMGGLSSAEAMFPQPTAEAESASGVIKAHGRGLQPPPDSLPSSGTAEAR